MKMGRSKNVTILIRVLPVVYGYRFTLDIYLKSAYLVFTEVLLAPWTI